MQIPRSPRQIVMLQRKASKPGQGLGKTTGWIHRTTLLSRGVKMIPGVSYQKIDDDGLHVVINGETQVLAVDNVVICAGQERCLKRRMRRIRHVALINKQGGRNAESRCQFFSVFQR
ncbi:2,4-dienoyl-CoA reductase [Klebsiella pneumoniae]|nr:2,4-dienoyl-CoA reductase [Klebsiella pneumoniae]